jgi:hypothetical protein
MVSRPRWRVKVGLVLAAATLAVTAFGGVTAAPASAMAWNEGGARLTWPVITNNKYCTAKNIYLKAGYYRWKLYVVHPSHPDNPDTYEDFLGWYFRAGTYRWQDCIGEAPAGWVRGYIHCSWIDELATPGGPAKECHGIVGTPGGYGTGSYEYGSGLSWTGT